jgi:hypothetical protein
MDLISDPTCAAGGIEEESALHFICVCILSVSEYEGMSSAGSFVFSHIDQTR